MLSVRAEIAGDHSLRVSPLACVNHFSSTSRLASGLPSPGMKWPTNQPRVARAASATFPKCRAPASILSLTSA